ncbi:sulfur carrier protein [Thermosulfidibacter takaii ABI70S6]|uniref:Sulfur carrier protein n=1 Tax=Thermosulfidibacter takaii (strain DSM 17441 / JCM 13301 / NBRC 103674 / ABI70S6) TaxID=1298851 RepID=A0A0S3QVM9_THET7|nr:hypothetical protein [Thermosulfidibacter takaii]BAT72390.1 sulfur carrier protein [Thermosulfidibacter takaii ABI70S6]
MEVIVRPDDRRVRISGVKTVSELLDKLWFRKGEVIVIDLKNRKLLPPNSELNEDMYLEVRRVISGG